MKTSKTFSAPKTSSTRKTPSQKAKERLQSAMEESSATTTSSPTSASPANMPQSTVTAPIVAAATKPASTPNAPLTFKKWRITTFSDISTVDEWFQDKLLYILAHLLRKGRILKRRLIEFTFPEKGPVGITWQDIATGETIEENKATGGVVTDEEDPLA